MERELARFVEQVRAKVRAKEVQESGSNDNSKKSETKIGDTGAKECSKVKRPMRKRQASVRYHG